LTIVEGGSAMTDYVEALEANTQIPPGCRADLLAVAAALQAQ
jgi:N-methylhydantoinase B/oxoprolinase/acetone carboxylase alpha subunit